jgi:hypothetical protein
MLAAVIAVVLGALVVVFGIRVGRRRGWGWGVFLIAIGVALALGPKGIWTLITP